MTTETQSRAPLYIILAIFSLIVVFGLFAVAMQAGVGMMILLVICAGVLGGIALFVFRGITATGLAIADKRLQSRAEDYRHTEAVLKLGHMPETYEPIQRQQIAAPVQQQLAAPAKGIHFSSASADANAVNLLLYSINLLGQDCNRIASVPECAAANMPGFNSKKWSAVIHEYFQDKLGVEIATVKGPVENGGGAFVPESIGTIGELYSMVVDGKTRRELEEAVLKFPAGN
jgi:hypothetical protein